MHAPASPNVHKLRAGCCWQGDYLALPVYFASSTCHTIPPSACPPSFPGPLQSKLSLCQHGPGAKCVHCIVPDDPLNKKHVSYEEFIAAQKAMCKHAPSYALPPLWFHVCV